MSETVTIICPTCHRPEVVELPSDLMTVSQAAKRAGRAIQTIMGHIYTGNLRAYPGPRTKLNFKDGVEATPQKMVSKADVDRLYKSETEQAS